MPAVAELVNSTSYGKFKRRSGARKAWAVRQAGSRWGSHVPTDTVRCPAGRSPGGGRATDQRHDAAIL